jgi:hypothetical protein
LPKNFSATSAYTRKQQQPLKVKQMNQIVHPRNEIVLYLLTRNDIPSMTSGKMAVQISHLTSDLFIQTLRNNLRDNMFAIKEWIGSNRSGNTVILSASAEEIKNIYHGSAGLIAGDHTGLVDCALYTDVGYSVYDGDDEHIVPKFTGAWFLAKRRAGNTLFRHLPLYKGSNGEEAISSRDDYLIESGIKIGALMADLGLTDE